MSVLLHRAWAVVSNPLSFVSLVIPRELLAILIVVQYSTVQWQIWSYIKPLPVQEKQREIDMRFGLLICLSVILLSLQQATGNCYYDVILYSQIILLASSLYLYIHVNVYSPALHTHTHPYTPHTRSPLGHVWTNTRCTQCPRKSKATQCKNNSTRELLLWRARFWWVLS